MKTDKVIKLLTLCSKSIDEEIVIQWWTKSNIESYFPTDEPMTNELWQDLVYIWDNDPLSAEQAGVLTCLDMAKQVGKERRRDELASKLKLITGGK